ncbi:elongation of very long chain fatty acids protein 4 [Galendromus occidentalis]|uniref:Elongation of very long chain fatty acids protein n=1 Tax=Galendromus occidentalis TaxID=34638 RepID=A0AAJ6VV32_9ACAR|nr:elongation of very long chain fatty acids protein 4 [Galendromus occidentalis]
MSVAVESPFLPTRDPRTENWFLLGDLKLLLTLLVSYIYLAKKGIPKFMESRKPMKLVLASRIYSSIMTAASIYFLMRTLPRTYFGGGYSFVCQGVDYNDRSEQTMEVISLMYYYLYLRIFDFVGTMIYAFQKKTHRVNMFHIYHHCISVAIGVYGLTYGVEGQAVFGVCVNMCVHVLLYSYYFLASFGPKVQSYLFWKRHLANIELFQFLVISSHILLPVFARSCSYPVLHSLSGISIIALMTILFLTTFK